MNPAPRDCPRKITERHRAPGGVAAFIPARRSTLYITPIMDFSSGNGVLRGRRGRQVEFALTGTCLELFPMLPGAGSFTVPGPSAWPHTPGTADAATEYNAARTTIPVVTAAATRTDRMPSNELPVGGSRRELLLAVLHRYIRPFDATLTRDEACARLLDGLDSRDGRNIRDHDRGPADRIDGTLLQHI